MASYPATSPSNTSIRAALRNWLYSIGVVRFIATALFGRGNDHLDDLDYDDSPAEDLFSSQPVWSSNWHTSGDGTFETKAAVYRDTDGGYIGGVWVSFGGGEPNFDFESEESPIFDLDAAMTAARDLETSHHCSLVSESSRAA